jgi:hypothetical protein
MLLVSGLHGASPAPRATELAAVAPVEVPCPSGSNAADVITIDWRVLRTLDFKTGQVSDTLRSLERRLVRLAGFVVPLEDFQERAKEFLLVPYFGACIHSPPPPANQIVHVLPQTAAKGVRSMDAVWISGVMRQTRTDSYMGASSYRIDAKLVEPYTEKP